MRRALAAALVIFALWPVAASAHLVSVDDADDSPGRLDLMHASVQHDRHVQVDLETFEVWEEDDIDHESRNFVAFEFDTRGDRRSDRCFIVRTNPSETFGQMFNTCDIWSDEARQIGRTHFVQYAHEGRGITAYFPKRYLKPTALVFRWRAVTSFEEEGHPDCPPADGGREGYATCIDRTAWRRHR